MNTYYRVEQDKGNYKTTVKIMDYYEMLKYFDSIYEKDSVIHVIKYDENNNVICSLC